MSTSDDEFTDELEQDEEIEAEEADDIIEAEAETDEAEEGVTITAANTKVDPALEEEAQVRTVSSRDHLRQQLDDEIKRFLSGGGQIKQLAADDAQKA